MSTLILFFNKTVVYNLKVSAVKKFVISELEMISHAQNIGIFVINILAKFHVSLYKKIHIMSHYLSLFFSIILHENSTFCAVLCI